MGKKSAPMCACLYACFSRNAILNIPKFQVGGRRIHSPGTNIPAIQGSGTLLTAEVVELYIVPK